VAYKDVEKRRAYHRKWNHEHREEISARIKNKRHRDGISKKYNCRSTGEPPKARYRSRGKEYSVEWESIRSEIYARDKWLCRECGIKCHCNQSSDRIQCHHIDYNIRNNNPDNLITLCVRCHAKTNYSKGDWIKYFQDKARHTNV